MTVADRRSIEDMALVLIVEPELGNDLACIRALLANGFRASAIFDCLDEARALARQARIDEGEIWARLNQI